jgi:uncharacterized membrane protein (DUF4010 family)
MIAPMVHSETALLGFATALGCGLLIGIERERRKGKGPTRAMAGVRTFALAALAGAGAQALDQPLLIAVGAALIGALATVAYLRVRTDDPGVTTEVALLVTYLLGVLAMGHSVLAAGGAVVVTTLLASRNAMHRFSVDTLSEMELRDALVFAAAALILLPVLPDRAVHEIADANPRRLWELVVLFMALQAVGYVALRAAGARLGLALSGLAAGFVSSTSTIAALGVRARTEPTLRVACVAGALFSTVATIVLLGIVVLAVCPQALPTLAPSLGLALVVILAAAGLSLWRQSGRSTSTPSRGRAFNLLHALAFAGLLTAVTAIVSLARAYLGGTAVVAAAALAGAFDVHAAAASTLSLAASGKMSLATVPLPILAALSANTASKLGAAFVSGGRTFGTQVGLGLILTLAAAWVPLLFLP